MHLALIMDGNRRWAKRQWLVKMLGHSRGGDAIERVVEWCVERGDIDILSAWALSKDNIKKRESAELSHIYDIIRDRLPRLMPKLLDNGVSFHTVGNLDLLPDDIAALLQDITHQTTRGNVMKFIITIGYGWQDEIVRAVQSMLSEIARSDDPRETANMIASTLDEAVFSSYLDTAKFPHPDLIVRTGGHERHSGYWLYSSEYSEYRFTETFWPDFSRKELDEIMSEFTARTRNFWK